MKVFAVSTSTKERQVLLKALQGVNIKNISGKGEVNSK